MKKILLLSGFVFLTCGSCAPFLDSPFSDQLLRPERNIHLQSLGRLGGIEADGVIRIAVFADPHQNYKALDKVLFEINQTADIDFVAGLGDYTNSGYNLEYDQFLDGLEYVTLPKLMALGNHDAIGAGPELFRKAFGDPNFFFESPSFRFIFFNANNLETPDDFKPDWLKARVDESAKPVIIFSHVQLQDQERFSGGTAAVLGSIVEDSKVKLALNGHNHVYQLVVDHGTLLLQAARAEGSQWLVIELQGSQVCIKRMDNLETDCRALK